MKGLQSGLAEEDAEFEDIDALNGEKLELEGLIAARNARIVEIKERRAWNIDNICKVTEEKSVVNKTAASSLKAEDFTPTGITEKTLKEKEEPISTSSSSKAVEPKVVANKEKVISSATNTTAVPSTVFNNPPSVQASATVGPVTQASVKSNDRISLLSYNDYVLTHEALLEEYSEIHDLEATKEFLFKHCDILLHEHSQSYMLLSSLEDEMNGKKKRMKLVCRQSQILSHITELGASMKLDPRDVVIPFFKRISEPEYFKQFLKAVEDFQEKICKRAIEKRKEMDAEREQNGQKVVGPGGLDPYEVLEQLPTALREAFESQDIGRLQTTISEMSPQDAKKYMKMCVDSGLWVPSNKNEFEDEEGDEEEN